MSGRHIFIGDVHGMDRELGALLARLEPRVGDVLVFLGDLVDKGPEPAEVVGRVRALAETAPFDVILLEGNHENKHRRYRRNLTVRPGVAAEQATRNPELVRLTETLGAEDIAFLDRALPFYRADAVAMLLVHGGIPGNMTTFPEEVSELDALSGKARRRFEKILRTRFLDAATGEAVALDHEKPGDPFWADVYDGRFGHVVFGHQPFFGGPAYFPHATGIDTGAVHGGELTAMVCRPGAAPDFIAVKAREIVPIEEAFLVDADHDAP